MLKKLSKIIIATIVAATGLMGGFTYLYRNGLSDQYANTEAVEGQIKVACVGDSITYGLGIRNWQKNNYPVVLQELLGETYHVANFGSSGSCVNPNGSKPYRDREIYQKSLDYDADILVFMLGTNDAKPENWTDMERFMSDYMELLGTYMEGENPPKLYIGICSEAYFVKESENGIAGFDIQPAIVDEIAERLHQMPLSSVYPCSVIDIHALTEAHPEWFKTDGIHPDKDGARAIAQVVAEAIRELEENSECDSACCR